MRTEFPVCRRCLLCLPLRIGLIVWGIIDLVFSCIALTNACIFMSDPKVVTSTSTFFILLICSGDLGAAATIVLNIALIAGCVTKNIKTLRIYYRINYTFILPSLIVYTSVVFGIRIYSYWILIAVENYAAFSVYAVRSFLLCFSYIPVKIYLLLLVRSEIIKLDNGEQFRFTNNAADAECTMETSNINIEQETAKKTTGIDSDDNIIK